MAGKIMGIFIFLIFLITLSCCREVIFARYYGIDEVLPYDKSQIIDTIIVDDPIEGHCKKVYIKMRDCGNH